MASDTIPVKSSRQAISLNSFSLEVMEKILENLDENRPHLLASRLVNHSFERGVSSLLRFKTLTNWIDFKNRTDGIFPTLRLTPESQNAPEEEKERELKVYCSEGFGEISSPTSSLRVKGAPQCRERSGHRFEVGLGPLLSRFSYSLCALSFDHLSVFPSKLMKILESVPHLRALELSYITLKTDCDTPSSSLPALPDLTFLKLKRIRSALKKDANNYFYGYITNQLKELEVDGVNYPGGFNEFGSIKSLKTLVVTTPTRSFLQTTPSTWLERLSVVRVCPVEDITPQELFYFLNKFSGTLVELRLEPSWLSYDPPATTVVLNHFDNLRKFVVKYPDGDFKEAALIRSLMRKFGMLKTLHFEHFLFKESVVDTDARLEIEKIIQFLTQEEGYWNICPKLASIHATVRIPRKPKGSKILAYSKIWERT